MGLLKKGDIGELKAPSEKREEFIMRNVCRDMGSSFIKSTWSRDNPKEEPISDSEIERTFARFYKWYSEGGKEQYRQLRPDMPDCKALLAKIDMEIYSLYENPNIEDVEKAKLIAKYRALEVDLVTREQAILAKSQPETLNWMRTMWKNLSEDPEITREQAIEKIQAALKFFGAKFTVEQVVGGM